MKTKLVIFGITGDLSTRKLIPSLSKIVSSHTFEDLSIIGVSRRHPDEKELLGEHFEVLGGITSIFSMDLSKEEDFTRLKDFIALKDDEQLVFYLSVPPESMTGIVGFIGKAGMNMKNVKLMVEKPFGIDLESSHAMLSSVADYFDEEQTFRIDHYLAKEMSQNIIYLREKNAIFDHLFNKDAIEKIEVVAYESIGIEGRAEFYEQTGALRDVLQGHVMELLSLILMDIPYDYDENEVSKLRAHALNQIEIANPQNATRGQYSTYKSEVENNDSATETFVRVNLQSEDPNWDSVPLVVSTGKALAVKTTEVRLSFKKSRDDQENVLIIRIQPNEGFALKVATKVPGYDETFTTKDIVFDYTDGKTLPDGYEQVLVDGIRGNKRLFASSEEIIRSWEILKPLQDAWKNSSSDLVIYKSGVKPESIN